MLLVNNYWRKKDRVAVVCDSQLSPYCVIAHYINYQSYVVNVATNGKYVCKMCSIAERYGVTNWVALREDFRKISKENQEKYTLKKKEE